MKYPIQFTVVLAAIGLLAACQTTPTAKSKKFDETDTNHDGRLSREEISDRIVTEVFDGRDPNKNGKLTKAEWDVPGEERRNSLFRKADANHDGVVTLAEAKAFGRKRGVGNDFYKDADTNHDGYDSLKEARAYYASKEGPFR